MGSLGGRLAGPPEPSWFQLRGWGWNLGERTGGIHARRWDPCPVSLGAAPLTLPSCELELSVHQAGEK